MLVLKSSLLVRSIKVQQLQEIRCCLSFYGKVVCRHATSDADSKRVLSFCTSLSFCIIPIFKRNSDSKFRVFVRVPVDAGLREVRRLVIYRQILVLRILDCPEERHWSFGERWQGCIPSIGLLCTQTTWYGSANGSLLVNRQYTEISIPTSKDQHKAVASSAGCWCPFFRVCKARVSQTVCSDGLGRLDRDFWCKRGLLLQIGKEWRGEWEIPSLRTLSIHADPTQRSLVTSTLPPGCSGACGMCLAVHPTLCAENLRTFRIPQVQSQALKLEEIVD